MTASFARLAAALVAAAVITGCGKKAEKEPAASVGEAPAAAAKPVAPGKEVLPGASSVRAAMAKKDYETAVGALLALKGAAVAGPQTEEYMALYDEVKGGLIDVSLTEPKANAALMILRSASAGR